MYGEGLLADTVFNELRQACAEHGGAVLRGTADGPVELVLALTTVDSLPAAAAEVLVEAQPAGPMGAEGFLLARRDDVTVVLADEPAGLLYGLFHLVRLGESAFGAERPVERHGLAMDRRMLDHWDNIEPHPVMGQVERGYAGGSIFWRDGGLSPDRDRIRAYGRLLAACRINAVAVNNVNVHAVEARLLTERLADLLRSYGIRVHLSVTLAAPIAVGGLPTADPLDKDVRTWWWPAAGSSRCRTSVTIAFGPGTRSRRQICMPRAAWRGRRAWIRPSCSTSGST
ncbi:alpha-glucuronidase family glycosyl hydrolase [Micromonospora sp. NBC_01412]|uniref:alpha-glucuronidase family glycosyl hydrolase n=1 Tax=Micromonospora sp. NBC_01412 TaxID=2903590 RepID=UPI00324AAC91